MMEQLSPGKLGVVDATNVQPETPKILSTVETIDNAVIEYALLSIKYCNG
ncbi:hypothetical protein [Candidatus Odyssella thessalonicensis]|nr:hypothetical protein [Candidatus Odyssella thessalonicensis]